MCLARVPDRMGSWKCWFLRRRGNWGTQRKTTRSNLENRQETQPTSRCRRRDSSPGHIGGRRELSQLRFPGLHVPSLLLRASLSSRRTLRINYQSTTNAQLSHTKKKITTNKPDRNSIADCKKRTTIATNDVDSRFSYSKNNCRVVTVFYCHSPKTREKAVTSKVTESHSIALENHTLLKALVRNQTMR